MARSGWWTALAVSLMAALPAAGQREFGFDNRKASGQPYLPPEETVRRMKAAEGFEVKLFAAEPQLVNPIAMTVDEKGRVWVVECFEYPKRTPKGKMPRDRIKVLEDTDGDGVCDKVTVFAEGKDFPRPFDLASGIEVGHGGVFLGAPPYLWFLKDTDGDGRADTYEILLEGFGSQDTHETLNTFQWGPDGALYGLHGVFTHSEVKPGQADGPALRMNAAVWRYDVRTRRFETFAEGTSNPWGLDWRNTDGQFILCCCVIPHLFHMSPGGIYKRQAGQSFHPHVYGYLNEICDHTFHRESGWAHAGLVSLDTPLVPEAYRSSVVFGSIHGCSVKRNTLVRRGSTFVASRADDFVQSGDKNFRPINLRWGPHGEIYCIDWHDQNPCHQAAADSWDYERGRVYRIQPKGLSLGRVEDLGRRTTPELVLLLDDPNPWKARTALRLLTERRGDAAAEIDRRLAAGQRPGLTALAARGAVGPLEDGQAERLLERFAGAEDAPLRGWLVRMIAGQEKVSPALAQRLVRLAGTEPDAAVRLELAHAARRLGARHDTTPLVRALLGRAEDARDPVIPQSLWLAFEPRLAGGARAELAWLREAAPANTLLTEAVVPRALRRLAASGRAEDMAVALAFVVDAPDGAVRRQALEGIAAAVQNRQVPVPEGWAAVRARLLQDADPEVRRLAGRLAVSFQDVDALRKALTVARNAKQPAAVRVEAVRDLAAAAPAEAFAPLLELACREKDAEVRAEACRALAGFESPEAVRQAAPALLAAWKDHPPAARTATANLLAGRKEWARELLTAVGRKQIAPAEVGNNAILRILALRDRDLARQVETVWGKSRETPAELAALIDRMRGVLAEAPGSFARGRKVFENQCAKCHRFDGAGHDVGPALDGAGRDVEYLLVNVLDPNRVVGQPYFTRLVTLRSGRVESGLLAAEDDSTVTLKGENNALRVIPKKDIEEVSVQEKSVMPEGLANAMTPGEFRDLVRYLVAHPFLTEVAVVGPLPAGDARGKEVLAQGIAGQAARRPVVGVPGRIPLPPVRGEQPQECLVVAEVAAPAERAHRLTRLLVGAAVPVEVWLNGKKVFEGVPAPSAAPDQASVEVELAEGLNRVVVRAIYRGEREALYVRLLDPHRRLKHPEPRE